MSDFAVTFDCDGTLISSHLAILKGIQLLMSEYFNREVTMDEVYQKYDADMKICASNFGINLDSLEETQKLLKRWSEISLKENFSFALYPEIEELIKEFASLGIDQFVWTGRDRASTLQILTHLGVMKTIIEVQCADDTIPKPNPAGLKELVSDYKKENVIHIGDSYTDITGAHEFGIKAIGALWGEHADSEDLQAVKADYLAKTPMECLEIIKKEFNK